MKTLIGLFMKIRVCLVKHLVENTYITLTEMLSKICVYSIIPTLSTSSDIHAYWVLIFHFYSQHRVFCSENRADLLWNYFSVPVFQAPEKTIRSKPFVSFHIIFYPRKVIAFYNQNDSHTDYVVSRLPSHITCMSVIAYCST